MAWRKAEIQEVMAMLLDLALLLVFLAVLSKSSDSAVEHAEKISAFFGISRFAIGFLLISSLTSLPELSISISASLVGSSGIVFGNVFSSNIFNMLFIIGASAILYNAIKIGKREANEVMAVFVITTAVIVYILLNAFFGSGLLGFAEGIALLGLFAVYVSFANKKQPVDEKGEEVGRKKALLSFIIFVLAIIVVLISASLVVEYAIKVAAEFDLSEGFIGATLISIGSSLPELFVSVQAARRKSYGIIIGTCVGSSLFNILLVFGSALVLNPINLLSINHAGITGSFFMAILLFNLLANIMLFYFAMVKQEIGRTAGLLFIAVFSVYLAAMVYLQF